MTVKYKTTFGDASEEFQFDTVEEMIRYFDYAKYDKKMDEDFYPEFQQGDVVKCVGVSNTDSLIVGKEYIVENIQIEDHGERMLVMENGDAFNMDYYLFEKVGEDSEQGVGKISYQQKTLDGNDKQVLKEAFDKIGIEYEDHGDFVTICESALLCTDRIDINFDERNNYKFESIEEMV